jgi:hypothetical protein
MQRRGRLVRVRAASLLATVVGLAGVAVAPSPAVAATPVSFTARIDGRPLSQATDRHPLRLDPKRPSALELTVTNRSSQALQVRTIRLAGTVIGLTFFGYETTVGVNVVAGATVTRQFSLELAGLSGQATGLLPASVTLLDQQRHELASHSLVVDVRGSIWSVYGVFGLALVVVTALSIGGALLALSRNQLPLNRWRRGLRFLPGGIGIGLSVVFTLSAVRVFVARSGRWVPIVLVAAAVLFAVGYLTPADEEEPEAVAPVDTSWWQPARRR